jgi:hypothetical protein
VAGKERADTSRSRAHQTEAISIETTLYLAPITTRNCFQSVALTASTTEVNLLVLPVSVHPFTLTDGRSGTAGDLATWHFGGSPAIVGRDPRKAQGTQT